MSPREDGLGTFDRSFRRGWLFRDREDAGKKLARALLDLKAEQPLVLGIPRGGVPVAYELARTLNAELDVIVARKLGAPGQEELAMGAIAADGTLLVDERLRRSLGVSDVALARIVEAQREEAARRQQRFRQNLPPLQVQARTVIVVDDGLATGATMRAALRCLSRQQPRKLVAAVPVGAAETCADLEHEADAVVCLHQLSPLFSVGAYYRDFAQTSDDDVLRILSSARSRARSSE